MFGTSIYQNSPIWGQELLISARALMRKRLREGPRFERVLKELERSQWLSADELADLQFRQMREVVENAIAHVPYYTSLFKQHNLSMADITTMEDFSKIPILTRAEIDAAPKKFLADNVHGLKIAGHTSGTTGAALTVFHNLSAVNQEHAHIWRQLQWAGFRKGQKRAWIRGDTVVPLNTLEGPFWRYNRPDNMLMMSSYHFSEANAQGYIDALEKFDPVLIQAAPSSINYLANFLDAHNRDYQGKSLVAIVTSSETLPEEQRTVNERRFGCRVYDWYGSLERVAAIGTCEQGRYHVISDYSYMELLPKGDGTAEIVGTNFHNAVMPLIRYKTNDSVELEVDHSSCPCGRQFPTVKKVMGRMDDYIKLPDGRSMPMMSHTIMKHVTVAESQVIQNALDHITIKVVPFVTFTAEDEAIVIRTAHEKLGGDMKVTVEVVDTIPRTKGGKLRAVISHV